MTIPPRQPPVLYGSDVFRQPSYGGRHPLAIPRAWAAIDLMRACGWLAPEAFAEGPVATPGQLARFHDPDYVAAVMRAEAEGDLPDDLKRRHGLGRDGNAIHPAVYRRPATACGTALAAAERLRHGGIAHSPAGGTHHARRDRAAGFCIFNDAVLAILAFLDQGLDRVLYVDLDAHHGDGVEAAFLGEPRVVTVSIHESGRWPHSGATAAGDGGTAINLAVPPDFNDSEMGLARDQLLLPLADRLRPDALVVQGGCDALAEDPQSRLALSNNALWDVVAALRDRAPRLLLLGGGGYNPWAVARCWAGYWALLNGFEIPDPLPAPARAVLAALVWPRRQPPEHAWLNTIRDAPRDGVVRQAVGEDIDRLAAACGLHGAARHDDLYTAPGAAAGSRPRPIS